MTDSQRKVLAFMAAHRLGCLQFEGDRRWVWPEDIRQDPALADRLVAGYPPLFAAAA